MERDALEEHRDECSNHRTISMVQTLATVISMREEVARVEAGIWNINKSGKYE